MRWDLVSVQILCPYYRALHHDGPGEPFELAQIQLPHCDTTSFEPPMHQGQYQLWYSFEAPAHNYYSYKIAKTNKQFVTVDVLLSIQNNDCSSPEASSGESSGIACLATILTPLNPPVRFMPLMQRKTRCILYR